MGARSCFLCNLKSTVSLLNPFAVWGYLPLLITIPSLMSVLKFFLKNKVRLFGCLTGFPLKLCRSRFCTKAKMSACVTDTRMAPKVPGSSFPIQ